MARQLPPLDALEAFRAAAAASSFRSAADALALSAPTFSRRIAALESHLGLPLFDRSGQTPVLTAAGARYLQEIEPHIEAIEAATIAMRAPRTGRMRIAAREALAAFWLMPQLRKLQPECPNDLFVNDGNPVDSILSGDADIAIVPGHLDMRGLPHETLAELSGTAMSAPRMMEGRDPPRRLRDLRRHDSVVIRDPPGLVESWLDHAQAESGVRDIRRVDSVLMAYEGAAAGLGVTFGTPLLVEPYLAAGRLLPCFAGTYSLGATYQIAFASHATKRSTTVRRLVRRLREAVVACEESFEVRCRLAA